MKFKRKRLSFNTMCYFPFKRKRKRAKITTINSEEESDPPSPFFVGEQRNNDPKQESSKDASSSELHSLPANIFAIPEDVSMMSMNSSASNTKQATKVTVHNSLVLNYTAAPLLPPLTSGGGDTVTCESFRSSRISSSLDKQKSDETMIPSLLAHSGMFQR